MKPSAKTDSPIPPSSDDSADVVRDSRTKPPRKQARRDGKLASAGKKIRRPKEKTINRNSGIRETEEARALLERQLHSLYWWVFNAFKMKGFIRAKALDGFQRVGRPDSATHAERHGSGGVHIRRKSKRPNK